MHRLVALAQREQMMIQLAYYPPYHSKYNPVERTFGWLEQHWRGSLLNSVETVVRFAESLIFKGNRPTVSLVTQTVTTQAVGGVIEDCRRTSSREHRRH